MNIIRYLTFEINRECPNCERHADKCPNRHPERYAFSRSTTELSDAVVMDFWSWCRGKGFRGIVLWHMYNEPALALDRVRRLMGRMRLEDPLQPFQMTTSIPGDYRDFDIVKVSDYSDGTRRMDNRIATAAGEGRPYSEMPARGWCGRGSGWEIPIDNYGNWCLCCGDWRCEEAIGSICTDDWDDLYLRFQDQRKRIRWEDERGYKALPRLCRACLDVNPALSRQGGI